MSIIRVATGYILYQVAKAFSLQNLIRLVTYAPLVILLSVVPDNTVYFATLLLGGILCWLPAVELLLLGEGEDSTMFWLLTKFTGSAEVSCPHCGKPVTVPGCIAKKADRIYVRHIVHRDCMKSYFDDSPHRVVDELYSECYGFVVCEQIPTA